MHKKRLFLMVLCFFTQKITASSSLVHLDNAIRSADYDFSNLTDLLNTTLNGQTPLDVALDLYTTDSDRYENTIMGLLRYGATDTNYPLEEIKQLQHTNPTLGAALLKTIRLSDAHKAAFYKDIKNDNLEGVELFLKYAGKEYINKADSEGKTPLHHTATNTSTSTTRTTEMADLLLAKGARTSLYARDNTGKTPLHHTIYSGNNVKMVELFLSHGAADTINIPDNQLQTPLSTAAGNGELPMVELLLNNGAKILDNQRYTILNKARGNLEITKILLKNGATGINTPDDNQQTPLWWAVYYKNTPLATLLLENGAAATINLQGTNPKETALHLAVNREQELLVTLLLAHGAAPSIMSTDSGGNTPLHLAAKKNLVRIIRLLLENGTTGALDIPNNQGQTPLMLARVGSSAHAELLAAKQSIQPQGGAL